MRIRLRRAARRSAAAPEIWEAGGWRRVVALGGAAYCLVAWLLPVVIERLLEGLPYLEARPFVERLSFSAAGSAALVAAMFIAFPRRRRIYQGKTLRETVTNAFWAVLGLAVFTFFAAFWSGNTLGALAKLIPGDYYSERFTVIDVDSRRRSFSVTLLPKVGTQPVHLPLSGWLFDRPEIRAGDELIASGKRTLAGVYIDRIQVFSRREGRRP